MTSIIALARAAKNRYFLAPGVSGIHSWMPVVVSTEALESEREAEKLTSFPRKQESILLL
jgi:hypothetical protein